MTGEECVYKIVEHLEKLELKPSCSNYTGNYYSIVCGDWEMKIRANLDQIVVERQLHYDNGGITETLYSHPQSGIFTPGPSTADWLAYGWHDLIQFPWSFVCSPPESIEAAAFLLYKSKDPFRAYLEVAKRTQQSDKFLELTREFLEQKGLLERVLAIHENIKIARRIR